MINEPIGTTVDLKIEGENDAGFGLIDVFGNTPLFVNEGDSGVETGSATTEWAAPYFVLLAQSAEEPGEFHVSSNHRLIPYDDVDDGTHISIGQTDIGSIDYPGDSDYFVIDLDEGDTIDLAVDSILINPVLSIGYLGAKAEEFISDDNSGGGFFGVNAALTYRAPHSGSYFIVVGDQLGYGIGGYFLTVAVAPLGAIPAVPPSTPTSPEEPTTLGPNPTTPMKEYKSAQYPFTMQYPAQWAKQPQEEGMTAAYAQDSAGLFIAEEDLAILGAGDMTLEEYVEVVLFVMAEDFESFELISRQRIVTDQGLPVEVIVFSGGPGNIYKASRLVYVHENKVGFNATYLAPRAKYQELEALIDSSFSTFEIIE